MQGARRLTADEIVARHQAAARRQASAVHHTIATGTLTLTFEAPGFPAPMTITSTTVIYTAPGRTELEQRDIRVNGVAFPGGGVPKLPILEPERVAAVPLTISLSRTYRYRLAGEDVIDGIRCHVVAFEPLDPKTPLFTGRAWIAMDGFALVRVAAAQTGLRGAIVSSEQVDDYRERASGIWMLVRSDVRQLYEGAAHRTPIQRLLTLSAHEINPPAFEARLQRGLRLGGGDAARHARRLSLSSPRPARRRRRSVRRGERPRSRRGPTASARSRPASSSTPTSASRCRSRVSATSTSTCSTPAPSSPRSSAAATRRRRSRSPRSAARAWQLAGRAFGIASSYNDRAFRDGREIYDENLRQRPAHASAWLLRPLSPRLTLRAGYEFDYTRLTAADSTAASFVVPADHVRPRRAVRAGGAAGGMVRESLVEPRGPRRLARLGTNGGTNGRCRGRRSVPPVPADLPALRRDRGPVRRPHDARDDADRRARSWGGGTSTASAGTRSAPSTIVSAGIRPRSCATTVAASSRGAVAWASGRFARLDGFLDVARVRDRGYGRRYRTYTGVGAALEAPAPFGLLTAVEWGYGFRGLNADGSQGTHVIRLSAYKIF